MKYLLVAWTVALATLAGATVAGAQTQQTQKQTDPAHPLANPNAPAPDCRSDSIRGGYPPCGATNVPPNGTQGTVPKGR